MGEADAPPALQGVALPAGWAAGDVPSASAILD